MPNLQYIGARYVPVVFDNPDDHSANWKSGVSYENLVIVTYLDDSYTSRKPVPSSVGDPASNPDYWAKTGDFNAALTYVQNEIDDINTNLKDPNLDLKNLIMVMDSFGSNVTPNISTLVPQYLGIPLSNVYKWSQGGAGFGSSCPKHFIDMLQAIEATVPDDSTIKTILVTGGSNDVGYGDTESDIITNIEAFMTYAKATFPNANVIIAFTGWTMVYNSGTWNPDKFRVVLCWYMQAIKYGAYVIDTANLPMHLLSNYNGDEVHPTTAAQEEIAMCIANNIKVGSPCYHIDRMLTLTPDTGVTLEGTAYYEAIIDDTQGKLMITLGSGSPRARIKYATMDVQWGYPNASWLVGTFNDSIVADLGERRVSTSKVVEFASTQLTTFCSCEFIINGNSLYLRPGVPVDSYTDVTIYLQDMDIQFNMFEV